FLGRANLLPVMLEAEDDAGYAHVRFGSTALRVRSSPETVIGRPSLLCVRPHAVLLGQAAPGHNSLTARVAEVRWKGELHDIGLEIEGHRLRLTAAPLSAPPEAGASVGIHFAPEDGTLVPDEAGG
ncbi:MAG: TOBE domain-containing protein, partial [Acetobacteraceae bacterium]